MTKEKEEQKLDILDEVKKVEKMVQVAALQKMLVEIKKKARQILELKEETTYVLDELGISAEDSKRIIDFVNSLGEVKLSEEDKKDLRQRVKKNLSKEKEDISTKISKKYEDYFPQNFIGYANSTGDRSGFNHLANPGNVSYAFTNTSSMNLQDGGDPSNTLVLNL